MALLDREVLALRHFEQFSNSETAEVLGLTEAAASNRYVRALKRLKSVLTTVPTAEPPAPAENSAESVKAPGKRHTK